MPPEPDELHVSDLMKPEPGQITSDWEAYFPKSYRQRKSQFSIFKKLYPLNRKKILLYPLLFILILSVSQAFALYLQAGTYELNVSFEKNNLSKWLDNFSFASQGATFISEEIADISNSRLFHLKFDSDESSSRFLSTFEQEARSSHLKNLEIEKELHLKQIESIRAKIHQSRIAGNPDLLQLRADQDIHEYLLHGENSLKQRLEYYHKILYIDDFARHNVLEVFHLRKKELEIPLLKELENLSAIIQKESPLEIKEMIDRIKVKQDEYLDELMQREMEDIPDKYLTPARKELLLEEKKLRILFHDWKLSENLFQAYREKLEKNKTDSLDKIYIQSDLRIAETLMKKVEAIDLEIYENQTPFKVTMTALPISGMKLIEIMFLVSLFLIFYALMWVRMIITEKKFPRIDSAIEFEDRLRISVAHQIIYKDLIFDPENLELNSFYQQIGAFYSQAKNIVGKTELILFHSGDAAYSTRDLAYLYAFGIAAGGGRVCLVDSIQIGNWEFFGQLDRGFSLGLIEMINGKCDLKDSVYGTEFCNLFVSPLNTELRILKSKSDENAGAQWDSKFDKIIFADSDLLADDILDFFKNHRVVIYYMVSAGDLRLDIDKDIAAFRAKNAEVKIIFKK